MPQRAAGLLLWARRAGDIDRLGGRSSKCEQCHATPDTTRLSRLPVDRRRRDADQTGSYA